MLTHILKKQVVLLLVLASFSSQAQKLDKAAVDGLVQSKSFVFHAETALPMRGMAKQLTTGYDMSVLGDSVVAYLPYYGRAYAAPLNGEGGIKFTSTQFDYTARKRKKGGWEIAISPKDARDVRKMNLIISENGYATLQVTSNNRQNISFNGYITERK